jgi:hypothetical protein
MCLRGEIFPFNSIVAISPLTLALGGPLGVALIKQVELAASANAADRRHALLEGRKTAVSAAIAHATVLCAPGIFDCGGRARKRGEQDENNGG